MKHGSVVKSLKTGMPFRLYGFLFLCKLNTIVAYRKWKTYNVIWVKTCNFYELWCLGIYTEVFVIQYPKMLDNALIMLRWLYEQGFLSLCFSFLMLQARVLRSNPFVYGVFLVGSVGANSLDYNYLVLIVMWHTSVNLTIKYIVQPSLCGLVHGGLSCDLFSLSSSISGYVR